MPRTITAPRRATLGLLLATASLTTVVTGLTTTDALANPPGQTQFAPAPQPQQPDPPAPNQATQLDAGEQASNLTRIYRAADSSYLFLKRDGATITGYGEQPGSTAFVVDAKVAGDKVTGKFWDVAKGARTLTGSVSFKISNDGKTLTKDGGTLPTPKYDAVNSGDLGGWPAPREASFQSTSATDLDGAFTKEHSKTDTHRAYVRDTGGDVVAVLERGSNGWNRPAQVLVLVGKRSGGSIEGRWTSVPKGTFSGRGPFDATPSTSDRSFVLNLGNTQGGMSVANERWTADYAIDFNELAGNLQDAFLGSTVGFAWAVAHDGEIVKRNAGGNRMLKGFGGYDGPNRAFDNDTINDIASTSKTVTAVAVAKALNEKGLTIDTKVLPYLPATWSKHETMKSVTFRQLLTHQGLVRPAACDTDDRYACLKDAVKAGMTAPAGYNNIHYTLMRVVLPAIKYPQAMKDLFENASLSTEERNEAFSAIFRSEIKGMLQAEGITTDFSYWKTNNALGYKFNPQLSGGVAPSSTYLAAGSGGMRITATDYTKFLAAFDAGTFVPKTIVADMKAGGVGFDGRDNRIRNTPVLGRVQTKNGGTAYVNSQGIMLPGGTQIFVTINSDDNSTDSLQYELWDAWRKSIR